MLVENGLALAALELPGGSSTVIELGVALDLTLVALVAAVFHERIFAEFGAGDTPRCGACVTSRELLAARRSPLPALLAACVCCCAAPAVPVVATIGARRVCGRLQPRLALVALCSPGSPTRRALGRRSTPPAACLSASSASSASRACSSRPPTSRTSPTDSFVPSGAASAPTSSLLFAFWAILLAVPLAGNLGGAWLLVEATTAASALLVGFSGKPRALEAGWKYLILTSLGLGVALLGIVVLAAGRRTAGSTRSRWRALAHLRLRQADRARRLSPARSPGSPPRSAGRRCTTGCPTPTPRRPRPSRRCSRRRCCPPCCSSPGASSTRSRR